MLRATSSFVRSARPVSFIRSMSCYTPFDGVVDPEWVQQRIGQIKIFDCTLHLDPKRNAIEEFKQKRIPTAQYFNIDKVADCQLALPHMLPTPTFFKKCVEDMGLNTSDEIVFYDTHGLFSASRPWWMFRLFNPNARVYVMNGGMPRWEAEKRPTESGEVKPVTNRGDYVMCPDYSRVCVFDDVVEMVKQYKSGHLDMTVVDARPTGRFDGVVPEARPGLYAGHMPGSKNIPFNAVADAANNFQIHPPEVLKKIFADAGVNLARKQPIVFSCGSGTTACVLFFAAHLCGRSNGTLVYDGSWAEYGKMDRKVDVEKK